MKHILLLAFLLIPILHADTDGLIQKVWFDIPAEVYDDSVDFAPEVSVDEEVDVQNDYISPTQINNSSTVADEKIRSILDEVKNSTKQKEQTINESETLTPMPQNVEITKKVTDLSKSVDIKGKTKELINYFDPLVIFAQQNTKLTTLFLLSLVIFLYLLFYRPFSKDEDSEYDEDDEFEIVGYPSCEKKFVDQGFEASYNNSKSSILTHSQYSTLYGLINESFIYEKERVLFAKHMTEDRKNREMISLEWKFNNILHFTLPKLSTDNSKQFCEGAKNLIHEEFTKEIMSVFMRDVLNNCNIDKSDKKKIEEALSRQNPKRVVEKVES